MALHHPYENRCYAPLRCLATAKNLENSGVKTEKNYISKTWGQNDLKFLLKQDTMKDYQTKK